MKILVTGGAGYIGSHAVKRLLLLGHRVCVIDNLYRGHRRALELLGLPRGGQSSQSLAFVQGSITDSDAVERACAAVGSAPDAVMHFAALAYVGESVDQPLSYFDVNITGLLTVLQACAKNNISRFVFSSSCSTYGNPPAGMIPVPEHCSQAPVSPYGRSKLMGEWIIRDFAAAQARAGKDFNFCCLRYFNVCGCDSTGLLGEDHTPESHLIPILMQVALGQRTHVDLFGVDYDTPDGTCIRDYVHVDDLAEAHVLALQAPVEDTRPGNARFAYNVGIGKGYSVREIIESARRVTGHTIPVREGPRRAGDAAMLYNDPAAVMGALGWQPKHTNLDKIVSSAWDWFKAHPTGYKAM